MDNTTRKPPRVFTYDFTVLALASAFGFCNIAVFYGFPTYLDRLGVPRSLQGALLGFEPLAAVCLRPFLSVFITPRNALNIARLSLAGLGLALISYQFVTSIPAIAAVRLLHGVAFVCLVSSGMAMLVLCIPKEVSGKAFGYFSLSALIPYAVMPPLAEALLARLGREDLVYALCALLVIPGLLMLAPLNRRLGSEAMRNVPGTGRPRLNEMRQTLDLPPVRLLLLAALTFFVTTPMIYFFMKPFALGAGLSNPGLFFTVFTAASILARVLGGPVFDRLPKEAVLCCALFGLAVCMAALGGTSGPSRLLILAALYGLGVGVAMPLLNASLFGHSPPAMRGTVMNLSLFMMDVGYVLGPLCGGAVLAGGLGYGTLFYVCCLLATLSGGLVLPLGLARLSKTK